MLSQHMYALATAIPPRGEWLGLYVRHSLNSGTRIWQKCAKERTLLVRCQGKTHLANCLYGVVCLRARVCVCAVCMAHCLPQQFDCFIFAEPLFNRKYNNTCTRTWAMEEPPLSTRSIGGMFVLIGNFYLHNSRAANCMA